MDIKKEEIMTAFDKSTRNRYIKLFEYYKDLFTNKDYLANDIVYKINMDSGLEISYTSVKYIRSRIMKKRVIKPIRVAVNTLEENHENGLSSHGKIKGGTIENFEFKEPQSIDHNQEIVTFRKSKI
jgi:hypothetical protein